MAASLLSDYDYPAVRRGSPRLDFLNVTVQKTQNLIKANDPLRQRRAASSRSMSLSALNPHRRAPHRVRVPPYLNTFLSQRLSPTPVGITGRHSHSITRTSAVPTHITASTSVCGKRRRSGTVSQTTRTTSGSERLSLSVGLQS